MYAIIDNGGKQYKVEVGQTIKLEKLNAEVGAKVDLKAVMFADENGILTSANELANIKVVGEVLSQEKMRKIIVFKYKAKKNERKKQGHRQPFTSVKIESITK